MGRNSKPDLNINIRSPGSGKEWTNSFLEYDTCYVLEVVRELIVIHSTSHSNSLTLLLSHSITHSLYYSLTHSISYSLKFPLLFILIKHINFTQNKQFSLKTIVIMVLDTVSHFEEEKFSAGVYDDL